MECTVRLYLKDKIIEKKVESGTNLLKFLRDNSIEVDSVCAGRGTCGKCRVRVRGFMKKPKEEEKKLLGEKMIEKGYRLSCINNIESDLEIFPDFFGENAKIVIESRTSEVKLEPYISKKYVMIAPPGIKDQASDLERLLSLMPGVDKFDSLELISELPQLLRKKDFAVTMVFADGELIVIEPGDTTKEMFGIAIDIGSTTVAAYLYDIASGDRVDTYSTLNPQRRFGADVLSRIEYAGKSKKAQNEMNKAVIDCVNDAVKYFTGKNKIKASNIYMIVFAGNTTMMHFIMNIPAGNIAVSPFIPVTTLLHNLKSSELGIKINKHGMAVIMPSISGYIGADITAGILSCGMHENEKISLLVDIGTNGEIVLGNRNWLYSCSTAAGPAFEGANIKYGVGGITGAIDSVRFSNNLELTTIGGGKAIGICGSGIVDAVACMLATGVVDETGRIVDVDEQAGIPGELQERIVNIDGTKSFLLLKSEETMIQSDIFITQRDVRELQNAKAAIAAGIRILAKHAGIRLEDIEKVYLAGGFGNYINIDSALAIGLIPRELEGRIESIGNSAAAGAILGLLSGKMLNNTRTIKEGVKYVELSASTDFVEEYVDNMMF